MTAPSTFPLTPFFSTSQDFALLLCDEDTPVKSKNKECTTLALESPQAARPNKPPEGPAGDPNFVGPNIGLYVDLPAPRKRNDNGTKYNTPASTLGFKQIDERSCPAAGSLWFGEVRAPSRPPTHQGLLPASASHRPTAAAILAHTLTNTHPSTIRTSPIP